MKFDEIRRLSFTEALESVPQEGGERFSVLFRHGSQLTGLYAPRGEDPQEPHEQDELYIVATGTGTFFVDGERHSFEPLDVLFAPAGVEHRFEDFSDDLALWVVFYGPAGGEGETDEQ